MELHIYGRNLDIDDKTREHVESKLDQIDRHLPGLSNATVELAYGPLAHRTTESWRKLRCMWAKPSCGPSNGQQPRPQR